MSEVKLDANGLVTTSISLGGNTLSSDGDKLLWNGEEFASSSSGHNIGGHNVGEQWISMDGTIPLGGVPFNGQILNVADYQALYNWAKDNSLFKTESEWQTLKTSNNNNVPFYSKEADTPGQKAKSDYIDIEHGDLSGKTTPTHIIFNGKSYDFNDVVYENINSLDELPFTVNAMFNDLTDPGMDSNYSWLIEFEAKQEGAAGNNIVIEFQGSNSPSNNIVVQLKGGVDSSEPPTFRVPLFRGYLKADSGSGYIKQGLPNITGQLSQIVQKSGGTASGAFKVKSTINSVASGSGSSWVEPTFEFKASNSIYGNSSNVTPETSKVLVGVYAFNTVVNAAILDATDEITSDILVSIAKPYIDIGYPYPDASGALIALRSVNYPDAPGTFSIFAKDATSQKVLLGKPDGSLTWDSKHIMRLNGNTKATNWYRKYSDGLIIQSGTIATPGNDRDTSTITLPTAFTSTTYYVNVMLENVDVNGGGGMWTVKSKTTTSFIIHNGQDYSGTFRWFAIGY